MYSCHEANIPVSRHLEGDSVTHFLEWQRNDYIRKLLAMTDNGPSYADYT